MRFGLKSLVVMVALLGIGAAAYVAYTRRPGPFYSGYLTGPDLTLNLVRQFDPTVTISGGGGGGGSSVGQTIWKTYKLTSTQPINESYFGEIRNRLLQELRHRGVHIFVERDLPVPHKERHSPDFTPSWGFEVLVEDHGFRGLIAIRLMPAPQPAAGSASHQGELYENIVVFPKD